MTDHPTGHEGHAHPTPTTEDAIKTMVTARSDAPPDGSVLVTPSHRPNIIVAAMTPFAQVLVRFARTYIQGLVGFLLLGLTTAPTLAHLGIVIEPGDFSETFFKAAGLALAPAVVSFLQNLAELLAKMDEKFPKLRA